MAEQGALRMKREQYDGKTSFSHHSSLLLAIGFMEKKQWQKYPLSPSFTC